MPSFTDFSHAAFELAGLPADIARQRVLDERAAASFVGLSHVSLERLRQVSQRTSQHIQLSARRLGYRLADLLSWLDERSKASSPAA